MSVSKKSVSLRTILNAFSQQGKHIETSIDAKVFEKKIRSSDEIQGAIHMMKPQAKIVQTYTSYKWKYEGNQIQLNFNVENLHELVQSIWALEKARHSKLKMGQHEPHLKSGLNWCVPEG